MMIEYEAVPRHFIGTDGARGGQDTEQGSPTLISPIDRQASCTPVFDSLGLVSDFNVTLAWGNKITLQLIGFR